MALGGGFDGAFVEGLEEPHFGYGIFFAAGKRAAVLPSPGFQSGLVDEDFEAEGGLAVNGNGVGKFAAGAAVALGAVSFEEIILIHVAVGGGVALDAADGIGARHGRLFVGEERMSTQESGRGQFGNGTDVGDPLALRSSPPGVTGVFGAQEQTSQSRGVSQPPPKRRPGPRAARKIGLRSPGACFEAVSKQACSAAPHVEEPRLPEVFAMGGKAPGETPYRFARRATRRGFG